MGFNVFNGTLEEYNENILFSVITLNNVLEHIESPEGVIKKIHSMLDKNGMIVVKVPNDFSDLQQESNKLVINKNWWICYPDHLNYFSMDSLSKLIEENGFEILEKTVDFPMELFLLEGINYIDNPQYGKVVHEKRKNFEMNIDSTLRKKIYKNLGQMGIGRNLIIFARKK